jgi:hypothetical protein
VSTERRLAELVTVRKDSAAITHEATTSHE